MKLKEMVPELVVEDVNSSIEFYKSTLGFEVVAQAPEQGVPAWAELVNGSVRLMMQEKQETLLEIPTLTDRTIGGTTLLVFRIEGQDSVRHIWSSLQNRDGIVLPLRETDYGTVEFGITDPDGYVLIFAGSEAG